MDGGIKCVCVCVCERVCVCMCVRVYVPQTDRLLWPWGVPALNLLFNIVRTSGNPMACTLESENETDTNSPVRGFGCAVYVSKKGQATNIWLSEVKCYFWTHYLCILQTSPRTESTGITPSWTESTWDSVHEGVHFAKEKKEKNH